jgi:hypothetical protein
MPFLYINREDNMANKLNNRYDLSEGSEVITSVNLKRTHIAVVKNSPLKTYDVIEITLGEGGFLTGRTQYNYPTLEGAIAYFKTIQEEEL